MEQTLKKHHLKDTEWRWLSKIGHWWNYDITNHWWRPIRLAKVR